MGIEKIEFFPFVLSPSKHNKGFAGQALISLQQKHIEEGETE